MADFKAFRMLPDATGDASDELYYVVDYDIPAHPTIRSRFYRAIHRWLKDNWGRRGCYIGKSTQSVIITDDPEFAQVVFDAALKVGGRVRLYIAKPVTEESVATGVASPKLIEAEARA